MDEGVVDSLETALEGERLRLGVRLGVDAGCAAVWWEGGERGRVGGV